METKEDNLAFYDMRLSRIDDNHLVRKPFHVSKWFGPHVHFSSFVPVQQKINTANHAIQRAENIHSWGLLGHYWELETAWKKQLSCPLYFVLYEGKACEQCDKLKMFKHLSANLWGYFSFHF